MKKISYIMIFLLCFVNVSAQNHRISEKELMEQTTQLFGIPALASMKDVLSQEDFSFVKETTEVAYEIYDLMFKMEKAFFLCFQALICVYLF